MYEEAKPLSVSVEKEQKVYRIKNNNIEAREIITLNNYMF